MGIVYLITLFLLSLFDVLTVEYGVLLGLAFIINALHVIANRIGNPNIKKLEGKDDKKN